MKLEKITKSAATSPKRIYEDACATAHALDLLGERWSLLIVRELMLGPRRFSELRGDLPGISANVLTQRLEGLEASGILSRRKLPPPAGVQVYELSAWGYEAEPIFQALGRWAARSPFHDPTLPFSKASLILSMRTMFSPECSEDGSLRIGIDVGGDIFMARVESGHLDVRRTSIEDAQAVVAGAPAMLAAALYGGVPLPELENTGVVTLSGDREAAERFTRMFPMPERLPVPAG